MAWPNCIETRNLTKRYPIIKGYSSLFLHPFRRKRFTALHSVNISIEKGVLFGLLGQNGAGKTTLIKILCTLVLPTSGKALVNGFDVSKDGRKIRKIIGYVVGDDRSFYWRLTGRQNLRFFARLNNLTGREAEGRINSLLDLLELASDADRMFKDYSTGMRRKVAIARGLLTNPEIIFMDEPTSSMDPVTAHKLRKFIREKLVTEDKRTIVFATHNLHEAEELCDQVAIVHKGEVRFAGMVHELKKEFSPGKRYVVKIQNSNVGLQEIFHGLKGFKKIRIVQSASWPDVSHIEFETTDNCRNIFPLIAGEVVRMGGNIQAFHEKEFSLRELFSRIIDCESPPVER